MHNSPFWHEDWMQTQQKYWQQWSKMSPTAQSPWENAMDHWWQAIAPQANNHEFMEKMLAQGKLFFRLGDALAQNMQQGQDWTQSLNKAFEQLQNSFNTATAQTNNSVENGTQQWINFMQGPINQWQKFAGKLPNGLASMQDSNPFSQILNMPGLGYAREDEERFKQLMQAGIEYQQKLLSYNRFFADLGNLSLQRMKEKVQALAEQGKAIDSGRAAYDLWVAASEEIYAARTMTPEYSVLHGELINALMKVKKQWGEMLDQKLNALGMPTRAEMRTLQTRLQNSRREIRAMQSELKSTRQALATLQTQIAEITAPAKKPIASTKKVADKKAPSKKVTKKKAVGKKTAKKKVASKKATRK